MSENGIATLTACGECCTGCAKNRSGACPGCIAADGRVPEWAGSGRCRIHACTRAHSVTFCGLCPAFPCGDLEKLMPWKTEIVPRFRALAENCRRNGQET